MRTTFGIDDIAPSGLRLDARSGFIGFYAMRFYSIPSGLHHQVLKGRIIRGLDANPARCVLWLDGNPARCVLWLDANPSRSNLGLDRNLTQFDTIKKVLKG